jgi:hypothetical protein
VLDIVASTGVTRLREAIAGKVCTAGRLLPRGQRTSSAASRVRPDGRRSLIGCIETVQRQHVTVPAYRALARSRPHSRPPGHASPTPQVPAVQPPPRYTGLWHVPCKLMGAFAHLISSEPAMLKFPRPSTFERARPFNRLRPRRIHTHPYPAVRPAHSRTMVPALDVRGGVAHVSPNRVWFAGPIHGSSSYTCASA